MQNSCFLVKRPLGYNKNTTIRPCRFDAKRHDRIVVNEERYFTYSAKSVRCISPLRHSVSCMAKAAGRQWRVCPPIDILR